MSRTPIRAYLGTKQLYKDSPRSSDHWTRPSDWLTLPAVPEPQGVRALVAVFDNDTNFYALRCSGAYTVDWGDGSSPQNYSSNTTASYNYNWNSINSNTLTSYGYRQAIITITPQSGQNLTQFTLNVRHSAITANIAYGEGWMDINVNCPSATTFSIGGANKTLHLLERVYIKSWGNITTLNSVFRGCRVLQSLNEHEWNTSQINNFNSMFFECHRLQSLDTRNWNVSSGTNFASMFAYCTSLKNIEGLEDWNVSTNCTTLSSMFDFCGALFCDKEILNLNKWNVSNATTLSFMFRECRSLKNISLSSWDVRKVTTMSTMFEICDSLQYLDISNWQPIVTTTNNNFLFGSNSIKSLKMPSLTAINSNLQFFAAGCTSLSMITFSTSGMNVGSGGILGFNGCNFSSASLNYIYQSLATNGSGKTINVTDNYGVTGDDPTIATNKGWTVTG